MIEDGQEKGRYENITDDPQVLQSSAEQIDTECIIDNGYRRGGV
jgi:hypothetical protein